MLYMYSCRYCYYDAYYYAYYYHYAYDDYDD